MDEIGMYILLEDLTNGDITKRQTIYDMKLYEIFDCVAMRNEKNNIEELQKSRTDGRIYF